MELRFTAQNRKRVKGLQASVLHVVALAICLVSVQAVDAQQLSIRRYDIRDGLAHSRVVAIHQDAKGYLWFGTWEGLSRFDGYRFVNYDTRDGLGHAIINSITEDRQGRLWVATNGGGVSRLIDDPRDAWSLPPNGPTQPGRKFASFEVGASPESNQVNALAFDSENNLWCATDDGLYRAALQQDVRPSFDVVIPHQEIYSALADVRGHLWFGGRKELIELVGGDIIKYGSADDDVSPRQIGSIVEDREGRLLVANDRSVFEVVEPGDSRSPGRWKRLPVRLRPDQQPAAMFAGSDGALWIATWRGGLIKYKDGEPTSYGAAQGLSENTIALQGDREGNLWIGTGDRGVCKLSGETVVSFTRAEGLPDEAVLRVIEDRQKRIYANTVKGGLVEIAGGKALAIPGVRTRSLDGIGARILQDRRGDWWIGTDQSLLRFQGPELQLRRGKRFASVGGIGGIYEDPAGTIWIHSADGTLHYFDPAQPGRAVFKRIPSIPIWWPNSLADLMVSDRSGALWVGGFGLLGRLRNGRMEVLQPTEGLPETEPRALLLDSRGWLWIGLRNKGVSMTKDPAAESPEFINYSTASGLASNIVMHIAEDDAGLIYLGSFKGLDRLDPLSGGIRHFTTADGLAGDQVNHCMKDSQGNIWVATNMGLSKLSLRAERAIKRPPPIYLSRIQIAGEDLPLPETGTLQTSAADLAASRNNLLIEFVGLNFQGERELRYQYKLEGADADWSATGEQQSVNYARLAAGSYRFLVRAINRDGISSEPAVFEFRILPPIWQRWWFLALVVVSIVMVFYGAHRYRVARLIELERVRIRIATDLHDDIGSSLSRMAILSEVVKRQIRGASQESVPLLTEIADTARGLVDGMSDIVWSIDPRRDDLSSLVFRIRQFASDVLEAKGITWDFQIPSDPEKVKLTPEQRRHIYLIFKEAINNIVRHASCASVSLSFDIADHQVVADVRDDGQGFTNLSDKEPTRTDSRGHGLQNMRMRARQLGGQFRIDSAPGQGTHIKLVVPLNRPLA